MDLQMPVMNGYETTEAIRGMGLHALPVIAMSANTLDEDRRRAFEAGMDDHLSKPVDVDELVIGIGTLIARRRRPDGTPPAHRSRRRTRVRSS
jgi:CheY-like chemotaxis protein